VKECISTMRICVVGLGYVGSVLSACLAAAGHEVVAVDSVSEKVNAIQSGRISIFEPDLENLVKAGLEQEKLSASSNLEEATTDAEIAFVCVGTPLSANGRLDLGQVKIVCARLATAWLSSSGTKYIALRSTVDPGTCRDIQDSINYYLESNGASVDIAIIYIPEFLREGTAIEDYLSPPFLIIGHEKLRNETGFKELIERCFSNVRASPLYTSISTSEIMKYACNSWHALKVAYANELGRISARLDIDSLELMRIFKKDTVLNISEAYLTPGGPYGGSCLPKDVSGLVSLGSVNGLDLPLLSAIQTSNIATSSALKMAVKTRALDRPLLIYGLAFKNNTDDIRNSPTYELALWLRDNKYSFAWYDNEISVVLNAHSASSGVVMLMDADIRNRMIKSPAEYALHNNALVICGKSMNEDLLVELRRAGIEVFDYSVPVLLSNYYT